MSRKQTYTFYFEIFGQKKKWSTEAISRQEAQNALNAFVLSKLSVVKAEGPAYDAAGKEKEPVDHLNDIFEKFTGNRPF